MFKFMKRRAQEQDVEFYNSESDWMQASGQLGIWPTDVTKKEALIGGGWQVLYKNQRQTLVFKSTEKCLWLEDDLVWREHNLESRI